MESPDPIGRSGFGESMMMLLALGTLYAAIGFTPWAWGTGVPWALFAFRALGLTALGVVALEHSRGMLVRSVWVRRAVWSVLALVAVSALSAVVSVHRGKSLEAMLNLLAISGLFLAAAMFVRGSRRLRSVAVVQVLAALPVAVIGLAQYFRPDLLPATNSYPGRALGPFGQPNRLGGYLVAVIPLAVALAITTPDRWLRAAFCLGVFLLTMCLVLTFSRGAWIGLLASFVVLAAAYFRWPALAPRGVTLAITGACLVLPALLFLPSILARIAPRPHAATAWNLPFDPEREGSGAMRRAIWSGALQAASARPVLGYGIGTFREAFDLKKSDRMKRLEAEGTRTADNAHNQWVSPRSCC
jgi:putative inorganic carbon (HCO3(-)) transporter